MTTDLKGSSVRGYLDLPWGQVHYRRAGSPDDPQLLMLHQSPLSSATYEPVLQPLADRGVGAIAVDTPGFGMSDPAPEPWSVERYARAVWQIADALGLDRIHLLGQHTGAVFALEAARQRPERVRGLVFQGIPVYSDEERAAKAASYAPGYVLDDEGGHLRTIWERVRWLYPTIGADSASRQVAEYLSVGPDYGVAYRAVFDHRPRTEEIADLPLLLCHGSEDVLNRMNAEVKRAFPHAPLVVIPGGTDFVAEERPEAFAEEVARHVRDHADEEAGKAHGITEADPDEGAHLSRDPDGYRPLHTSRVTVRGGRSGSARSETGSLDLALLRPAERSEGQTGTDPEELFAAGYAACFRSALEAVARRDRRPLGEATVTAEVTLGTVATAYGLGVTLTVDAESPTDRLAELVERAHRVCPYSRAVRGNIRVTTRVRGGG
ncbi:Ohr family peroxiredoxin [Streptomyces sp. NPDC005438]|uniref:Ohr family peroxiredoxin n=1 Tax=Streptomyces sp. NPDC005438 TaxID=3156880 RepID=UPI0033BF19A2